MRFPSGSLCSRCSLFSLRTLFTRGSLFSLWSLFSLGALWTWNSLKSIQNNVRLNCSQFHVSLNCTPYEIGRQCSLKIRLKHKTQHKSKVRMFQVGAMPATAAVQSILLILPFVFHYGTQR